MKHQVAELAGNTLDAAVAKAEGDTLMPMELMPSRQLVLWSSTRNAPVHQYSTRWELAGPIIDRERIATAFLFGEWHGFTSSDGGPYDCASSLIEATDSDAQGAGPTLLVAAMRAYVASKFGDGVEL